MRSTLKEEQVRALFSSCSKECDVLIGLLKLAIPNWDQVEYILEGKPQIGEEAWRTIYDLFCDFNENHPGESMFPWRSLAEHGVFCCQEPRTLGGRHLSDEVHLEERLASCEIGNIWINNLN